MIVRAGRRISLAALPTPPLSRFDLLSALVTGLDAVQNCLGAGS
jgi:hypothetical protein